MLLLIRGIIERFVIFFNFPRSFVECRDKWFDRPLCNCVQHARQNRHVFVEIVPIFWFHLAEVSTSHTIIITPFVPAKTAGNKEEIVILYIEYIEIQSYTMV